MSNSLLKLIKETWVMYFAGMQSEIENEIDPEILPAYKEAMVRLETDFDFQKEIGIEG